MYQEARRRGAQAGKTQSGANGPEGPKGPQAGLHSRRGLDTVAQPPQRDKKRGGAGRRRNRSGYAARRAGRPPRILCSPDLSGAVDYIFGAGQLLQAHGAPGMHFLGGDADLRPQAELEAVGEAGGGVDVHRRGVHLVQEALGGKVVGGDDGLGVAGAVGGDEVHRLVKAGYHLDGQDVVAELGVPVGLSGGLDPVPQDGPGFRAAPQLHALGLEQLPRQGQEVPRHCLYF